MTTPNDFLLVTPGSGATLASHLAASLKVEAQIQASIGGSVCITDSSGGIVEGFIQNDGVNLAQTTSPIALIRNPDSVRSLTLMGIGFGPYITNVPLVTGFLIRRINGVTALSNGGAGTFLTVRWDSAYSSILNIGYFPNYGSLIGVSGGISYDLGRLVPNVQAITVSTLTPSNIVGMLPNVRGFGLPDSWRLPGGIGVIRLPPGTPTGPWDVIALYMESAMTVPTGDVRVKFYIRFDEAHS